MAYAYYGKCTIDHTKCGTADSSNFPVYVALSDATLKTVANGGKITSASGFDLAFFSDIALSSALAFEMDGYDGAAGTYKGHVKVATLSKTTDTVIYFGYGDSSITTSQENVPSTWSNGFVSVFHFRDGTTLDLTDSAGTCTAVASTGGTAAVAGLVGSGAATVDGVAGHGFKDTTHVGTTACPVTLEVVFKAASALANGKGLVDLAPTSNAGVDLELRSTGAIRMNSGAVAADSTVLITLNTTHYAAGVSSSQDNRGIYLDNNAIVTNNTTHVSVNGTWAQTWLGQAVNSWNGTIDEIRVSNVVRGPEWITATYNTLINPSTFIPTITYGNSTVAGNSGYVAAAGSYSNSTSVYWNGSNRVLSVDVLIFSGVTVTAATYGGAAMTLIGSQAMPSGGRIEQWAIHSSDSGAPAAGINTLALTLSGSTDFIVAWVARQRIHTSSHYESFIGANGTNSGVANDAQLTVTTITDNSIVHVACISDDASITAGQTSRNNVSGAAGSGADEDPGAVTHPLGAVAMNYTGLNTTAKWAMAGYALRSDSAGVLFKGRVFYEVPTLSM